MRVVIPRLASVDLNDESIEGRARVERAIVALEVYGYIDPHGVCSTSSVIDIPLLIDGAGVDADPL